MRVVHVPFGYFPDPVGGTEVYVAELARGLAQRGVESVIAAPSLGTAGAVYEHEGVLVHRFPVGAGSDVGDLYGEGDAESAEAIDRVVAGVGADVLHLHAFTRAASLRAVRAARRRGVAVAFTYHTPTASCVRGTLLRYGSIPCDGELLEHRCTACLLQSRGLPLAASQLVARIPMRAGAVAAATRASGRWVTALRARELTRARHDAFRALLTEADAVVAVCEWVRSLLIRAGANPSRVTLSRQGTPARSAVATRARQPGEPLRLVHVGRLHPTKGLAVVVRALAVRPDIPVTLDVFGVAQEADGARYEAELHALAAADSRIRFRSAVASADVVATLAGYDATVVASQWLETGPLTVLESFAAGVPVFGSNLGGIAELVAHDRDGWLVPHANVDAWASFFARVASDRDFVARLAAGVRPPRTTDDVARDMAAVYDTIAPRTSANTRGMAGGAVIASAVPVGAG